MKKSMKKIKKLYKKLSSEEKAAMLWVLSDVDMVVFDMVTDEAYTIAKTAKEDAKKLWKGFIEHKDTDSLLKELGIE